MSIDIGLIDSLYRFLSSPAVTLAEMVEQRVNSEV